MKKYNIKNYIRYKEDIKVNYPVDKEYNEYTRDELIFKFLPLVENIARKFATSQQATGVMDITDLIQEGSIGLIHAVNKIIWETVFESEEPEKRLKSFLSKRIKGAIRRAIDINRADMRLPEYKLNEIRKNSGKDKKLVEMFFNSIFLSTDDPLFNNSNKSIYQIQDKSESYNTTLLNNYLKSLLKRYLNDAEYEVLRLSYGLDCNRHSANEIAMKLNIAGVSAYVRVSELKKQAVQKLIDNVDHSQVIDYL